MGGCARTMMKLLARMFNAYSNTRQTHIFFAFPRKSVKIYKNQNLKSVGCTRFQARTHTITHILPLNVFFFVLSPYLAAFMRHSIAYPPRWLCEFVPSIALSNNSGGKLRRSGKKYRKPHEIIIKQRQHFFGVKNILPVNKAIENTKVFFFFELY